MSSAAVTATLEDYLEAIFNISATRRVARSMEIADRLHVKRPSVSVALKALADKGLINYEPRSFVTLTDKGERLARCVDKRHHILRDVFTEILQLPAEEAGSAACAMEHGMNSQVCRGMMSLLLAGRKDARLRESIRTAIAEESRHIDCQSSCAYSIPGKERGTMSDSPLNLNMLVTGADARIVRIAGDSQLKKRLREMGITAGERILMVKSAPLDDPIEVKVRNYNISLRREEAESILVEQ